MTFSTLATARRCAAIYMIANTLYGSIAVGIEIRQLKCEYAVDPLGIDVHAPRLSWELVGELRGDRQSAWQIAAASSESLIDSEAPDLWDSGKQVSNQQTHVLYEGRPLSTSQRVIWKVRVWNQDNEPSPWSKPATWTMGVLDDEDWCGDWIVAPWESEALLMRQVLPCRPKLKRAIIHVCGLGQYEMFVNGKKSGDAILAPGWSQYNHTCLYETHDVTELLDPGDNVIGIALGDGMYHVERRNRFSKFQGTFGPKRAIAHIELWYADGSRDCFGTDDTWRVTQGPVTYNDVYGGEDFDARKAEIGWNRPDFDDSHWTPAVRLVRPRGKLRGHTSSAPAIRAIETIEPVSITRINERVSVIDLGQNASYMPRIVVGGPAGSAVRLIHAEVLDEQGHINRDTCGGNRGPAYWQYTKATNKQETWFPQFFYAGCRYLELEVQPAEPGGVLPELIDLDGVVVHSSAAPIGEFACSNALLNRIYTLVRWAQRSNMVSVLTDCPHREKLGWLEQYHLNGPSIRYEFDVSRIFIKSLQDMADSQTDKGLVPNIAPEYTIFPGTFRAAAEWGAAAIMVPWQQYEFTGDTEVLENYYAMMTRYMEYLATRSDGFVLAEGLGDWYDLGPADRPGAAQLTPPEVTATAIYYADAQTMAKIAELLGKADDASGYRELAHQIRLAWQTRFRNDDGTYGTRSQCSHALALAMGLARTDDREVVLEALVDDIKNRGIAITAGDVGWGYVLQALTEAGETDLLLSWMTDESSPGYAMILAKGETSMTEAWDANHRSSHNHFMLGQVMEWFYRYLVGIAPDPARPGFANTIIKPHLVGDITWAEATYNSVRGPIHVRWERFDEGINLWATLPANCTATVYVPAHTAAQVEEHGKPVAARKNLKTLRTESNHVVLQIGSGDYKFTVREE